MNDIIYILTLLGPLFTISSFLGEKRTKEIENFILKRFAVLLSLIKDLLLAIPVILFTTSFILYTFIPSLFYINDEASEGVFLVVQILLSLAFMIWLKWHKIFAFTIFTLILQIISLYLSGVNSITTFLLSSTLIVLLWVGYIFGSHILIHLLFGHISSKWHVIDNTKAPWPFSLGTREFHIGSINHYSVFSLFWVPYLTWKILTRTIILILLMPFYLAEILRKKITPEKPIFMDLFAYMLSVISIIYLSIERLL